MERRRKLEWNAIRLVVRREHEADVAAGELLVDRREAVELVLKRGGVLRVEEALDQAAAVGGNARALASDLRGVDKVLEDRLVHGGEGARVRTGLLVAVLSAGLAEDAALADEDNVTVRELLLELTGETVRVIGEKGNRKISIRAFCVTVRGVQRIHRSCSSIVF